MNSILIYRKKSWLHSGLCLLLAGLTGCTTTQTILSRRDAGASSAPSTGQQMVYTWGVKQDTSNIPADPKIQPGYLLSLHCPEDSKLDGDYRVEFDGNIKLPYDTTINTTGYTLSALKRELVERYRPNFKTAPVIDLRLKELRYWLDVRGLVEKPGRYLIEPDASLDMVIGLAGGLSKEPVPAYVRIEKGPKLFVFDLKQYYAGESNAQILGWLGGEVLFFQKESTSTLGDKSASLQNRKMVYLLGEIRKPGEYPLIPGSDIVDTMVQAGGFTERADLDHLEVIRQVGGGKLDMRFSWDDLKNAPAPQQGDIIMVHADRTPVIERKTGLFVAIIGALASVVTSTIIVLSYNKGRF